MCLSRAKAGGAMARPSCESSLLGIPEAKFFSRKAAASKNPSWMEKTECISQTLGFSRDGCRGRDSNALPSPTTPSLLCSGEGPILVHKFRARVHLRKIESLSKKWGAPQDSNPVVFPKPVLLLGHIAMPSIESETVSNKFVPSQGFISNEAGRCQEFFLSFVCSVTHCFSCRAHQCVCADAPSYETQICSVVDLIRVHPTRSVPCHFIVSVLPTNHLFDPCGP